MSKATFQVRFGGKRKQLAFTSIAEATASAAQQAKIVEAGVIVSIWSEGVTIGVVTDDANGITVHPLKTAIQAERDVMSSFGKPAGVAS